MEIFAGFAGAEVLYDDKGAVTGVATGDMGVNRKGEKTDAYQPGMELLAKYTLLRRGLPRPARASSCSASSTCAKAPIRRSTASA